MEKADLYSRALNCCSAADAAVYNLESEDPAASSQAEAEHLAEEFAAINESCLSRRFQELARKLGFYVVDLRKWKERNAAALSHTGVTALQMSSFVTADNVKTRHKLREWLRQWLETTNA